jgi:hypothetical protein
MAIRRSFYSQETNLGDITRNGDLAWNYAMTPRKWRTIYSSNQFQPSSLYKKQMYRPSSNSKQHEWIGKYYIQADQIPTTNDYVTEYEVMKSAGMYNYRILYAVKDENNNYKIKSKPAIEGRPGQMNLIMNTDNKIIDVQYW